MARGMSETLTGSIEVDFPEFLDPPQDPMALLAARVERATALGVREPRALTLATVPASGQPSARIVAIIGLTAQGLLFASHETSRKGREIAENPRVAGLLYWRETSEQIAIAGEAVLLDEATADERWAARPPATHAMSAATRQSQPLDDVEDLRRTAQELAGQAPLPRPAPYRVYEIRPTEIEFWADGQERLHERLVYRREPGRWTTVRLQP
ncbi:phenazine biosynthesis FMN-dependent oxidase PhzG [Myceligenerans crystallogenes]|uniref:Phenazine biosynthesis FMN-dependent oxidase PhzG n=1 Tax=Myceligenerans crystallogenes TaxID=316335 RepID=A0ABN2N7D9_9MICO